MHLNILNWMPEGWNSLWSEEKVTHRDSLSIPSAAIHGLEHVTLFLPSMQCTISPTFNSWSEAEFHLYQMCNLNINTNNCCFNTSFCYSFFSMIRTVTFEIWILTLASTAPRANQLLLGGRPSFWVLESARLYNLTQEALFHSFSVPFHNPLLF